MPEVPFCRVLYKGCSPGNDVIAHKRAISRAAPGLYPWLGRKYTPVFGPRFEKAVTQYQRKLGLPATGRIDRRLHSILEKTKAKEKPTEWAFDERAVHLCKVYCELFNKTARERILNAGFYWYSKREMIRYSQERPMLVGKPPWVPQRLDCSSFVTLCYYAAGAKDPNGRGYDGYGYTGTLIQNGRRITRKDLRPGDLVFYGFSRGTSTAFPQGSPTHVAVYTGEGRVLSFGSYPMGYYPIDYRGDINQYRTYDP